MKLEEKRPKTLILPCVKVVQDIMKTRKNKQ